MGMESKFVILDKSKDAVEALQRFIEESWYNERCVTPDKSLKTHSVRVKQYNDLWGLEGVFRNCTLQELEYWLTLEDKKGIVENSLIVIVYEGSDFAVLYNFFSDVDGTALFDIYEKNRLCGAGYAYKDYLPMNKLREYFCVNM